MPSTAEIAFARQRFMIAVTDAARGRALQAWKQMEFANLDASWAAIGPTITAHATQAQVTLAQGSDRFVSQMSAAQNFTQDKSSIIPEAFGGVDGEGRDVSGLMYGAVTTTKKTIGAGFGSREAMQAGATYLAAMLKTVVADMARAADKTSASGRGYTRYVRVVSGSGCSRCAILAGISSGPDAFLRHVSCQCAAAPIVVEGKAPKGLHDSPEAYFDSLSKVEQDRIFTNAGAEAIREGANVQTVVNARRGAKGIGYSGHGGAAAKPGAPRGHFVKSTIGYRANGTPVQLYTTTESITVRGQFGRQQQNTAAIRLKSGARYQSTARVRLMPESIMTIAGNDTALRQAFLRDAGYIEYTAPHGYDKAGKWIKDIEDQRRADRVLVNGATLKFNNFTLG